MLNDVDLVSILCSHDMRAGGWARRGPMTNSDDASQRSRVNISVERQIFVVPLLRVENVMKLLVCSRSTAYEHMNHALGRTDRPGRLLRVPLDVFESYIAN